MWLVCSSILNILRAFNDATHTFSGVYKPTSHQFLIEAMNVAGVLVEVMKIEEISYGVLEMKTNGCFIINIFLKFIWSLWYWILDVNLMV